jgi:hypothetical protein
MLVDAISRVWRSTRNPDSDPVGGSVDAVAHQHRWNGPEPCVLVIQPSGLGLKIAQAPANLSNLDVGVWVVATENRRTMIVNVTGKLDDQRATAALVDEETGPLVRMPLPVPNHHGLQRVRIDRAQIQIGRFAGCERDAILRQRRVRGWIGGDLANPGFVGAQAEVSAESNRLL